MKANWARGAGVQRWQVEPIVLPDELDPSTGMPIETSRLVFVDLAEGVHPGDVLRSDRGGDRAPPAADLLTESWPTASGTRAPIEGKGGGACSASERTLSVCRETSAASMI